MQFFSYLCALSAITLHLNKRWAPNFRRCSEGQPNYPQLRGRTKSTRKTIAQVVAEARVSSAAEDITARQMALLDRTELCLDPAAPNFRRSLILFKPSVVQRSSRKGQYLSNSNFNLTSHTNQGIFAILEFPTRQLILGFFGRMPQVLML
jgi:hypothetical protein